ncbi:MAG: DNA polymerase III subunit delta [Legionella sp.]
MLIKLSALSKHLQQSLSPIYVMLGDDPYLLNESVIAIKQAWHQRCISDDKVIHITSSADWKKLIIEANHLSLFTESTLLDVRYDKKSIDATGKDVLNKYLEQINPQTIVILRAPAIAAKQTSWLCNHPNVVAVQIYSLNSAALRDWIKTQLQLHHLQVAEHIPAIIQQYSEGNMFACAQTIEKLVLTFGAGSEITDDQVLSQLSDQCHYQLFALADACISSDTQKAIHILRLARQQQIEPSLILWLLAQEIRSLIELAQNQTGTTNHKKLVSKPKIWPHRMPLYKKSLQHLSCPTLYKLLIRCKNIDCQIKTNSGYRIWEDLEQLAIGLSTGKLFIS